MTFAAGARRHPCSSNHDAPSSSTSFNLLCSLSAKPPAFDYGFPRSSGEEMALPRARHAINHSRRSRPGRVVTSMIVSRPRAPKPRSRPDRFSPGCEWYSTCASCNAHFVFITTTVPTNYCKCATLADTRTEGEIIQSLLMLMGIVW